MDHDATTRSGGIERYPDLMRARDRFSEKHAAIRHEILDYLEHNGRSEVNSKGTNHWKYVYLNRLGRDEVDVARLFPDSSGYRTYYASIDKRGG